MKRMLERPFPSVERQPIVDRSRFDRRAEAERWTGTLRVMWAVEKSSPVVIGAGWIGVEVEKGFRKRAGRRLAGMKGAVFEDEVPERVKLVAEMVRRGEERLPVLPGSSLKGAVRQVYEFLTASCTTQCRIGDEKEGQEPRVCPACSLFGTSGLAGRVRFGEAEPLAGAAGGHGQYEVIQSSAPGGWTTPGPPRAEHRNKLRVYGPEEADWGQDRLEPTYAVCGRFESRIDLLNASKQELGVLLASLGVGWRGAGPGLRLGGKKYHGLGGVTAGVAVVEGRYPRMRLEGGQAGKWAVDLAERTLEGDRGAAFERLHRAISGTDEAPDD